ncbi:MAG: hypothetical protein KDC00_14625 [Flavobacteriales bacterium]|nr:hypothetical protein [Flavobacteriales bacterium]
MARSFLALLFFTILHVASAQTRFVVTNVSITEKDQVRNGQDVTAVIKGAEGDDRVVLYDQDGIFLETQVRVRTHNSNRSSVKEGAVYVTFEVRLKMLGENDRRTIQKVFYAEQERTAHIKEKFTVKHGIDVRVVTVEFDGRIE